MVRRLLAETKSLSSRIAAVTEIGVTVSQTRDLDEILQVIAKQARWLLDFDHLSVCLPQGRGWRAVTLSGDESPSGPLMLGKSMVGQTLRTGQARMLRANALPGFLNGYQSLIIIPLMSEMKIIGSLNFACFEADTFTQEDFHVGYLLALQVAAAIRNTTLFQQLKRTESELESYRHVLSHDLKTPLSAMVLQATLIKKSLEMNEPQRIPRYADHIAASTMNTSRMIDQLLWLTRIRNANESMESVDINLVVRETLNDFHKVLEAQSITLSVQDSLPAVYGHSDWVAEIFADLIDNAIKYMGENNPDKRILITAKGEGNCVQYAVTDTGVGIAPEDQPKMFTRFTRLHTVRADGLGLGLSIVQTIIKQLGGSVGVESTPGKGSTFWFTLPRP